MAPRPNQPAAVAKTFSTLVGHSGRQYTRVKLLQRHPKDSTYDIYRVNGDNQSFVFNPMPPSIFEDMQKFQAEFPNSHRLRNHVDRIDSENACIYEYFACDLMRLLHKFPYFPLKARKTVLKEVGLALKEMHDKHWVHLDVKPNNVFLECDVDGEGDFHLKKVALGDMDHATRLHDQRIDNLLIGNVMWRSPEGQLAKGVGKHSEVFSFGLLCIYVITRVACFQPDFDELDEQGVPPELIVLSKLLATFGPLPDALVKHIGDEDTAETLLGAWDAVADGSSYERFEEWSADVYPDLDEETKRLISRMTKLDPAERASITDIMDDPYWDELGDLPEVFRICT